MDGYDDYETIAFERRGRILTLTINRPDVLNAVNAQMHRELARLFYDVAADEEADIIVFTGAGRAFCAGGDLDWLQAAADDPALFARIAVEAKQIIFGLLDCEKPIICRLNGDAIGLGATLALFCDIIIASEAARIGDLLISAHPGELFNQLGLAIKEGHSGPRPWVASYCGEYIGYVSTRAPYREIENVPLGEIVDMSRFRRLYGTTTSPFSPDAGELLVDAALDTLVEL